MAFQRYSCLTSGTNEGSTLPTCGRSDMPSTVHTIAELDANIDASRDSHRASCEVYDHAVTDSVNAAEQLRNARAIVATLEDIDADLLHVMREAYNVREATESAMTDAYARHRQAVLNAPAI